MAVFHPQEKQPQNPEYWWRESIDMFEDARKAIRAGLTRKSVCNFLHGSIERALKAILAERGELTDADRSHSLVALATKAGLLETLPESARLYIFEASTLHYEATYPNEDAQSHIWCDNANYKAFLATSGKVHALLMAMRGKAGEHGGSGSGEEADANRA